MRKNGKVSEILKTMGTQMPAWKKEKMNKIAHVFLAKLLSSFKWEIYFQASKERYVFKEHSRIRLATIYIHHIFHTHAHLDLIVWLNSLWIRGLTLQYMYYKYALSCYHHSYELHISFSCRKKGINSLLPWWGSTNTVYFERLESVI